MTADFSRCKKCNKIFAKTEASQVLCPACGGATKASGSKREQLYAVREVLKDAMAAGEFLTTPELAERCGVEQGVIWNMIRSGEIDTASFNDPGVRDYLVRKHREQQKQAQETKPKKEKPEGGTGHKKSSGFHLKSKDD